MAHGSPPRSQAQTGLYWNLGREENHSKPFQVSLIGPIRSKPSTYQRGSTVGTGTTSEPSLSTCDGWSSPSCSQSSWTRPKCSGHRLWGGAIVPAGRHHARKASGCSPTLGTNRFTSYCSDGNKVHRWTRPLNDAGVYGDARVALTRVQAASEGRLHFRNSTELMLWPHLPDTRLDTGDRRPGGLGGTYESCWVDGRWGRSSRHILTDRFWSILRS